MDHKQKVKLVKEKVVARYMNEDWFVGCGIRIDLRGKLCVLLMYLKGMRPEEIPVEIDGVGIDIEESDGINAF